MMRSMETVLDRLRRIHYGFIIGRGIGIWLLASAFFNAPTDFVGGCLGAFLLYIFGGDPPEKDWRDDVSDENDEPAQ